MENFEERLDGLKKIVDDNKSCNETLRLELADLQKLFKEKIYHLNVLELEGNTLKAKCSKVKTDQYQQRSIMFNMMSKINHIYKEKIAVLKMIQLKKFQLMKEKKTLATTSSILHLCKRQLEQANGSKACLQWEQAASGKAVTIGLGCFEGPEGLNLKKRPELQHYDDFPSIYSESKEGTNDVISIASNDDLSRDKYIEAGNISTGISTNLQNFHSIEIFGKKRCKTLKKTTDPGTQYEEDFRFNEAENEEKTQWDKDKKRQTINEISAQDKNSNKSNKKEGHQAERAQRKRKIESTAIFESSKQGFSLNGNDFKNLFDLYKQQKCGD